MTIEEKAIAYDKAIERAKRMFSKKELNYLFPELKETGDEKVRKWLIDTIKSVPDYSIEWDVIDKSDVLAWLEKQGKKEKDARYECNNIIIRDDEILQAISVGLTDIKELGWSDFGGLPIEEIQEWLEKQGEHAIACSEEQMKVLDDVLNFAANHESSYWNDYIFETLCNLIRQLKHNETTNRDKFAQSVLRGAAINLITWIDYHAAEDNMCLSNMECKDIEDALVSGDWNKIYAYMKKKLEKQDEQKLLTVDDCLKALSKIRNKQI